MNRAVSVVTLAAGLLGTLACGGAMVLAIAGLAGTGVSAGMAGMGGHSGMDAADGSRPIGFLLDRGPLILVPSVAAVSLSFALRRRAAILPALLVGGVLYWGMYGQERVAVMYAAIVVGLALWGVTAIWTYRRRAATHPSMA